MRIPFAVLMSVAFGIAEAHGQGVRLGPTDMKALPPTDFGRVAIGTEAPDFVLASLDGPPVKLSQFRGKKNVVLVFYRGFW